MCSLKFSAEADWRDGRPSHFLLFIHFYRPWSISMTFLDFGVEMHATFTHLFEICHNYSPVLNELKNEIRKERSDKSRQSYCHLILTVHCLLHTHIIGRCKGKSLIVYYSVCGRLMLRFFEIATTYNFFQIFFSDRFVPRLSLSDKSARWQCRFHLLWDFPKRGYNCGICGLKGHLVDK